MKQSPLLPFSFFLVGFTFGIFLHLTFFGSFEKISIDKNSMMKIKPHIDVKSLNYEEKISYEQKLADKLYNEIKIFCWVFTHSPNHKTKVPAVRRTWGRRCDKLIFMSNEADPDQPDIIKLPIEDGRGHLWNKTKMTMKYVHDKYLNDYDWFMRADDDK
jgi:hypothetical protein